MAVTHETTGRTDQQLTCPVDGCEHTSESVQGLVDHVNAHRGGWDATDAEPNDVHAVATVTDNEAFDRATRARTYLARNGVTSDDVHVYYHAGYGNVQIRVGVIDLDEWDAFQEAVDVDGIHYVNEGLWYCTEAFVEELPESRIANITEPVACGADGCRETDDLQQVTPVEGPTRNLCPSCRKEAMRVST